MHDFATMGDSYSDNIFKHYDTVQFGSQKNKILPLVSSPIEWIVLAKEEDAVLLISKYIIDCKPFDYLNIEEIQSIDNNKRALLKNTTWASCSLRKWLNDDFLNASFSDYEKQCIVTTPLHDVDTKDKLFCLSEQEYKKYFDNGNYYERNRNIGDVHIYYNGATTRNSYAASYDKLNFIKIDDTYPYWLRDKDTYYDKIEDIEIGTTKMVGTMGEINSGVNINSFGGVRPAMWVSIKDKNKS